MSSESAASGAAIETTSTTTEASTTESTASESSTSLSDTEKVTEAEAAAVGTDGIRIIEAEREKRRKSAERAANAEKELAELRKQQMSDNDRAVADARTEGESTADARWRDKAGKLAVKAFGSKFADPADAMLHLGEAGVPFTEDGDVDEAALTAALDKILESKPYLAATTTVTQRIPTGQQGTPTGADDPAEMDMDAYRKHKGRQSA